MNSLLKIIAQSRNLIFNFRDYQFDIELKKNKAMITFDKRAVGGFQHASLWSGAVFEVKHAIPVVLSTNQQVMSILLPLHLWKKMTNQMI